jgi:predicted MFS family arabinose efflux permease
VPVPALRPGAGTGSFAGPEDQVSTSAKPGGESPAGLTRPAVVTMVAVLATATALSQFFRNSVGVIATTLADELKLDPDQLGLVASSFFLIFALCQIPVGIVIDRWGPRVALLGSSLFAVAGALVFAQATGQAGLIAGRLLLGIGCSTFFMAPLVIYARAFPPSVFASLAGFQIAFSSLGTILATAPLGWMTAAFGWRSAFLLAALVSALLLVGIVLGVRGAATGRLPGKATETLPQAFGGIGAVMRTPGFWPLFLMSFSTFSTFALFIGLWGGPYLAHVHGADLSAQGQVLFVMAIAQVVGTIAWGSADRLTGAYKPLAVSGALLTLALLAAIIAVGHRDALQAGILVALLGFTCAFTPVLVAHSKALFPPEITGRGLSFINMGTMSGTFVSQWLTGIAVKAAAGGAAVYPVTAFQIAFAMQAVLLAVATLVYLRAPEPRRAGP